MAYLSLESWETLSRKLGQNMGLAVQLCEEEDFHRTKMNISLSPFPLLTLQNSKLASEEDSGNK